MATSVRLFPNVTLPNNADPKSHSHHAEVVESTSRSFRVPDSDNEDEVAPIRSRSPSIQVLESNIRTTTYSVPSGSELDSDLDISDHESNGFETSSPFVPHKDQDSAVTTPEQQAVHEDESVETPNEKAIDLNLKGPKLSEVIAKTSQEASSENDNFPSVFTADCEEEYFNAVPSRWRGMKTHGPENAGVMDKNFARVDQGPEVLSAKRTAKQSDIVNLLNDKASTAFQDANKLLSHAKVAFPDPSDTERSRIEGIIRETPHGVARKNTEVAAAVAVSDYEGEAVDEAVLDAYFPIDLDDAEDFEDAALLAPQGDCILPRLIVGFPRTPSPSDAALARDSGNAALLSRRQDSVPSNVYSETTYTGFTEPINTWQQNPAPTASNDATRQCSAPSNLTSCHYNTGPFSVRACIPPLPSSGSNIGDHSSATHYARGELPVMGENHPPMAPRFPPKQQLSPRMTKDPSSMLHISSLVNPNHTGSERPTKRKAAELSLDAEDSEFNSPHSSFPSRSQETPLPDAQPRDYPMVTETSISLGEPMEPAIGSITTTVATESSQAEAPSRKKAKTSSTASGVGKFLLGVGVGAVGFAAAFLATIPSSVQEEVRLGL